MKKSNSKQKRFKKQRKNWSLNWMESSGKDKIDIERQGTVRIILESPVIKTIRKSAIGKFDIKRTRTVATFLESPDSIKTIKPSEVIIKGILDKTQKLYLREFRETSFAIKSEKLTIPELKEKYAKFKK